MPSIRDTIARVAEEEGIDPSYALAVAERESSFNPNAGGTGSIRGLFQLTGANRRKYGQADDADPEAQTRAFAKLTHDLRGEMTERLGREPTHGELYTGHHFGGSRAARIASGEYAGHAPSDIFSAREMAGNPHFGKARTGGELSQSIVGDIDRRMAKYGGGLPNEAPNSGGRNGSGIDFASFGQPIDDASANLPSLKSGADFAAFGQPVEASPKTTPVSGGSSGQPIDFAAFGAPAEGTIRNAASNEGGKINTGAAPVGLPVKPLSGAQPAAPSPGEQLKDLGDEMFVRQNAPDPGDAAFQSAVQQLQPQPQRI